MSFFSRSKSGKNLDKFVRSKTAADIDDDRDKDLFDYNDARDQDNAKPEEDKKAGEDQNQFGETALEKISKQKNQDRLNPSFSSMVKKQQLNSKLGQKADQLTRTEKSIKSTNQLDLSEKVINQNMDDDALGHLVEYFNPKDVA